MRAARLSCNSEGSDLPPSDLPVASQIAQVATKYRSNQCNLTEIARRVTASRRDQAVDNGIRALPTSGGGW
jgi:hypothetical protein